MGELPWGSLLAGGGPWAMLALAVVSVLRGWLVPVSTVTLLMQIGEDYKAAAERSEQARAAQAEQLTQLLEYARTADTVMRSLPAPREPTREPA